MLTSEIIEATLARLTATLPELAVELYPDRPEAYRLNHPVGALLLAYPGSSHGPAQPLGLVAQERTLRLGCTLVTRRLWGEHGAVLLLDRLRLALVGWTPPHAGKVRADDERFLAEDKGLWWYGATYATTLLTMEDLEAVTEPILTRIAVADDAQTTHIIRRDPDTGAVITEYLDP